jgi:DNA topoisomerase III
MSETLAKTLVIAEKPSVAADIVKALTPSSGKFEKSTEYCESLDRHRGQVREAR